MTILLYHRIAAESSDPWGLAVSPSHLAEHLEILLVLALGKPKENVMIDDVGTDGSIKYWRDAQDVHHVPKRSLDELIV